ncbi:MAG: NAD(P)-binding domain-containing protein [Odoribacter splanchnicus]
MKITIIGAGNIGGAIARGLVREACSMLRILLVRI